MGRLDVAQKAVVVFRKDRVRHGVLFITTILVLGFECLLEALNLLIF